MIHFVIQRNQYCDLICSLIKTIEIEKKQKSTVDLILFFAF